MEKLNNGILHPPQIEQPEKSRSALPAELRKSREPESTTFDPGWEARHNAELWFAGDGGTFAWRNQADGYSE